MFLTLVGIFRGIGFGGAFLCSALAFAQAETPISAEKTPFDLVQSAFFSVSPDFPPSILGEDDIFSPFYRFDFLKYEPTGRQRVFSRECEWAKREPLEPSSFAEFSGKWRDYTRDCGQTLQNGPTWGWANFYYGLFSRFRLREHSKIRLVRMALPHGTKLHGLLALKDEKLRPLVVFRLGIFSNLDQMYAERSLIMQIFEQGPFNMLVLESMTGSDFISRNQVRAFGGMDEAVQNLHVIKALRDPAEPISKLVQGVHLMGISMGANGQLLTHILQEHQENAPWVESTLLLCPPTDLQRTLDYHLNHRIRSKVLNAWSSRRLSMVRDEDTSLRRDYFLQDVLDKIASSYKGPIEDADWIRWPADWSERKKEFWKGNAFFPLLKDAQTPLMIVATEKDPIVPYLLNSGQIQRKQADLGEAQVLMWSLPEAVHCSIQAPYDWREMASIFQDFFLSRSPHFIREERAVDFEVDNEIITQVMRVGFQPRLQIFVKPGDRAATVRVTFYPKTKVSFWEEWSLKAREFPISVASLDLGIEGAVKGEAEAEMIRRWMHQNLEPSFERPNRVRFSWKAVP